MSTVLIAEDEPMIGRILEHKLTREGHRVVRVESAADADRVIAAEVVDVALVDVTLERDGIDLAGEWAMAGRAVRVVCLVEQRDVSAAARAKAAGVGVVLKPFKPTQVAARVAELLTT